jgi:anti-sigma regulatory factor (Ser/Thr protein kinase)
MQAQDQRRGHQEPGPSVDVPPGAGRHCRISLAPVPQSTRTARDFTIATLRGWSLDDLIQDSVMVVSELVTNAVRHGTACVAGDAGDARVELSWWYQTGRLTCTITDSSVKQPVLEPADRDAESGRGLQVVQALTVDWGWTTLRTGGKSVWAAFEF